VKKTLESWIERLKDWKRGVQIGMPLFVGVFVACAAMFFTWMIESLHSLWMPQWSIENPDPVFGLGYGVIAIPILGGLICGPLIVGLSREPKGHGVPEVMLAVSQKGGRIAPMVGIVKTIASAVTIGLGGSVGREGPIALIGSSVGSGLGQLFRMSAENIKLLVACGAAAGISATFNAPIAGAIFASEVILREFRVPSFSSVVIASVTATALTHAVLREDAPAFIIPHYQIISLWEIFFYAGLGLVCGVLAAGFSRLVYLAEDLFAKLRFLPEWALPAVGGLCVGLIGFWQFHIFGTGYQHITKVLESDLLAIGLQLMLLLFVLKLVATALTIGSGGSGGIFSPSLFLGAMVGGAVGVLLQLWQGDAVAGSGAYATVGMGALFAGAAHAPVTAILMIFEMTREPNIILPLMISVVLATAVSRRLSRQSIYTMKLHRRGLDIDALRGVNILDLVTVENAMVKAYQSVTPEMQVTTLIAKLRMEDRTGYPVLNRERELLGVVTFRDVSKVLEKPEGKHVEDIYTRNPMVCYIDETLNQAMLKLATQDVGRAPVISRDTGKILGMLERRDIINAATRAARDYQRHMRTLEEIQRLERGIRTLEVEVMPASPAAGKRVRDLTLPEDVLMVAIRRGKKIVVPRGATLIRVGDRVSVLVNLQQEKQVSQYFKEQKLTLTGKGTARF
jgi:CIC family chloride channel protein